MRSPVLSEAKPGWRVGWAPAPGFAALNTGLLCEEFAVNANPAFRTRVRPPFKPRRCCFVGACAAMALGFATGVAAADLKILSAAAVEVPALEVAQRFERDTGHRVVFEFATAGQVDERLA